MKRGIYGFTIAYLRSICTVIAMSSAIGIIPEVTGVERFEESVRKASDGRITYKNLIGK